MTNLLAMDDAGSLVGAMYFFAVVVAALVDGIAWTRFYDAYFKRYFPEDHKRFWPYVLRSMRERWAWLRPVEDPRVEQRRRQLVAAMVPFWVLVLGFFVAVWILNR